jgi:hypothetical protein
MTDVSEEYARRTGESTEGTTPLERATAYEVEAAQLIDRTIRKLPEGVTSAASLKLVELIVQAAVLRISAAREVPHCQKTWSIGQGKLYGEDVAQEQMAQAGLESTEKVLTLRDLPPIRHGESIVNYNERLTPEQSAVFEQHCADIFNSDFTSEKKRPPASPDVIPGEVDNEPNPETRRARAADRVEFNVGVHKATDG